MSIEIIAIISLVVFLILCKNSKERFTDYYGMNYQDTHEYLKCCNAYGCGSNVCQNYLGKNMSDLTLTGYISKGNKFHNLYKRYNQNTNRDEYFVKIDNKQKDFYHKKLDVNYLYDGDTVKINNQDFEVHMYDNYNYYTGGSWLDQWNMPNYYLGTKKGNGYKNMYRRRLNKYGRIEDANGDFKILYSKKIGRNQWQYYTRFGDTYIELDTNNNNKEIYDGDAVNVNGVNYTFTDI